MIPKSVYLDSNDFSDLSRPEDELNSSDRDVLALLRDAARNKRARFFISAVHISEAVHAYLLFNYFIDELGHREALYRIVRDQGEKWVNLVQDTTSQAIPLMRLAKDGNETLDLKRLVAQITGEAFWRKVVGSFAELDLSNYCEADILKAKDKSPSTSIFTYVLIESLLLKLQSTASRVSSGNFNAPPANRSDYADFMHAIYAPYFDVFRCDGRIGEVLKRTPIANNRTAARRSDLLSMLGP
jgi:hypothetical protein